MAVSEINFQGINRTVSDYGNAAACEELINLRPTGTGLEPVKPFSVKLNDVQVDKLFVHHTNNSVNYIAVRRSGNNVFIEWYDLSGELTRITQLDVFSVAGYPNFDVSKHISFAYTGNIVLISVSDNDDVPGLYANYSWLWTYDNVQRAWDYKEKDYTIPGVRLSIADEEFVLKSETFNHTGSSGFPEPDFYISAFNKYLENDKALCQGPFVIAVAYKTKDGLTFGTSQWFFYSPVPGIIASTDSRVKTFHETAADSPWNNFFAEFFSVYDDGYQALIRNSGDQFTDPTSKFAYVFSKIKLGVELTSSLSQNSEISSVEIYASYPEWYIDMSPLATVNLDMYRYWLDPNMFFMFAEKKYSEYDLSGKILYLQKSIPVENLRSGQFTFDMEFGGMTQTTSKTLLVDAGDTNRYGKLLSYNARFHYYDSVAKIHVNKPQIEFSSSGSSVWHVFMIYEDSGAEKLLYAGTQPGPIAPARLIIAPSLNVRRVVLYYSEGTTYLSYTYNMMPSTRYNFSIYDGTSNFVPGDTRVDEYEDMMWSTPNDIFSEEPSAINVTEQYSPAVFNVDNSYLAPGKVKDVQPQMVAVRDVSYGDYPLNVFTDRGVYALLQGSGAVLYAAFRPVSNLVTGSNSIPTEYGTFFIAAGGLWMISGNNAVLVSDALSRGPHKYIRNDTGFQALSMDSLRYDTTNLLSDPVFERYLEGATLSYNRHRDEIIVSNMSKRYSYVLSLKYRQWFKIATRLVQDTLGSDIAITPNGSSKDVLDFSVEGSPAYVMVHLQSRPFSFGYQYAHVHRIVDMVRASLSGSSQNFIVAIYGSDDLQQWRLLSYAIRKGPSSGSLKFSQVRTPTAARSWRYYTVCFGGKVPTDTDFGPVMIDYEPVIRRLG